MMTPGSNASISPEEIARQRKAMAEAVWSARMESLGTPNAENEALSELWITGQISHAELETRRMALVMDYVREQAAHSSDPDIFAHAATEILSQLNRVHPFRDGNGRAQRAFVQQLAVRAGRDVSFRGVTTERNVAASIDAHQGDITAISRITAENMGADRVELRMKAVADLDRAGYPVDEFWVETAQDGDHISGTVITAENGYVSLADDSNRFIIVQGHGLPGEATVGQTLSFDHECTDELSSA